MRRVKRILAVLPAIALLSTCSSPGSSLEINGDYIGTVLNAPTITLHLTVSGSTITGTGTVAVITPGVWRGHPDHTVHMVFAGTRDGRQVTSLLATESYVQQLVGTDWLDANVEMNLAFQALFNNNSAVTGNWRGSSSLSANPLGGTWSAVKESNAAGGILRP